MQQDDENSPILMELLDSAGDAAEQPLAPAMGIPRQKVPRLVRRAIKEILLPFLWLDQGMQRLAKKIIRPPFSRKGQCKRRGNCCYYILVRSSNSFMGKLFYFWYTQIQGFYPRLKKPHVYNGKKVWVMGCRYLKPNGHCAHYRLRPSVCRQWPVIEHFGYPRVLKGCGFYPDPPQVDAAAADRDAEDASLHILQ
ncbi:MAG: YkgJ family cysteine cluster protein [Chlamydiota bacterium]